MYILCYLDYKMFIERREEREKTIRITFEINYTILPLKNTGQIFPITVNKLNIIIIRGVYINFEQFG